jgi:hypothetical protein
MRKQRAKALVEHVDATLTWNTAPSIESAARETTERVGYPGTAAEVQSSIEERARAQVRSAAELALDPERCRTDKIMLAESEACGAALEWERAAEKDLRTRLADAERERADLRPPSSGPRVFARIAAQLLLSALFAVAAALLITSSLDAFVLRGWILGMYGGAGARISAAAALLLGLGLALGLHLGQSTAVIARRGDVPPGLKAGFVASDLLFAVALGMLRLATAWSWQALALTLGETALLLAHTWMVLAFAKRYAADAERSLAYRPASAKVRTLRRQLKDCVARIDERHAAHAAQLAVIARREMGARYAQPYADLMAVTGRASHLEAAGELAGAYADNPSNDALTELLDGHLTARASRLSGANKKD